MLCVCLNSMLDVEVKRVCRTSRTEDTMKKEHIPPPSRKEAGSSGMAVEPVKISETCRRSATWVWTVWSEACNGLQLLGLTPLHCCSATVCATDSRPSE